MNEDLLAKFVGRLLCILTSFQVLAQLKAGGNTFFSIFHPFFFFSNQNGKILSKKDKKGRNVL